MNEVSTPEDRLAPGETAPAQPRPKLAGLDAMRFYAAAMIVMFHLIYLGRLDIPDYLKIIKAHFAIGVPLFYLVSAFGLTLGYRGKLESRAEIADYFRRRFWRIAPLFYFVIAVTLVLHYFAIGATRSLSEIAASVLFVFNFIPQYVEGFVSASWSVGVEMAFYCILPVLLFAVTNVARSLVFWAIAIWIGALWKAGFADAPASLKPFAIYFIAAYLHYFAAGIAAYFAYMRLAAAGTAEWRDRMGMVLFAAGIGGLLVTMLAAPFLIQTFGHPAYLTMRAVSLVSLVLGVSLCRIPFVASDLMVKLGKTSFSLYLWHPIVILGFYHLGVYGFVSGLIADRGLAYLVCALVTFAALIPLSLVSYRLIEKPGMRMADQPFSLGNLVQTFRNPRPEPIAGLARRQF